MEEHAPEQNAGDQELVAQVRRGSRIAFETLYNRYSRRIYRFLYTLAGSHQVAEDLTHETFLRLYEKADRYAPTGSFAGWLYRMARNLAINHFRSNRRMQEAVSLEASADEEGAAQVEKQLVEPGANARDTTLSNEEKELFWKALMLLKPDYREAVMLCDVQALPHKEAAEIIACTVKALDVKLIRARDKLALLVAELIKGNPRNEQR